MKSFIPVLLILVLVGCAAPPSPMIQVTSFHQEPVAVTPMIVRGTGGKDVFHIDAARLERAVFVGGDGNDWLALTDAGPVVLQHQQLIGIDGVDARNQQQNDIEVLFSAIENSDYGQIVVKGDAGLDSLLPDPALSWHCQKPDARRLYPGVPSERGFRLIQPDDYRFRQAMIWVAEGVTISGNRLAGCGQ